MWYLIYSEDVAGSLPQRKLARPAHLARLQALWRHVAIPRQCNLLWQCNCLVRRLHAERPLYLKAQPHPSFDWLGHCGDHTRYPHIAPFPRGGHAARLKHAGTPTRKSPRQRHTQQQKYRRFAPTRSPPHHQCHHGNGTDDAGIHPRRPQLRLLQLQCRASHQAAHAANARCREMG